MKIILPYELDALEIVLNDISEDRIVVDPDTYCYFRDTIFIDSVKEYLKINYPKEFNKTANSNKTKWEKWCDTQRLIHKYYKKFNKIRQKFYVYNNYIYSYIFLGFGNVGNEIQLHRFNLEDLCVFLNAK